MRGVWWGMSGNGPLTDTSFATLGWLNRSAQAIGSDRFFEALERANFYLDRTLGHVRTPAERAVYNGLSEALGGLIEADRAARTVLKDSVSDINAADACEFVELCEDGPTPH